MTISTTTEKRSPFFCDMNAVDSTQRKHHVAIAIAVFRAVQESQRTSRKAGGLLGCAVSKTAVSS
jgi:hypothetical protein